MVINRSLMQALSLNNHDRITSSGRQKNIFNTISDSPVMTEVITAFKFRFLFLSNEYFYVGQHIL